MPKRSSVQVSHLNELEGIILPGGFCKAGRDEPGQVKPDWVNTTID